MNKLNNKSGFTLIEIIVVLIIVGILAAIALPNLFQNVEKSQAAEGLSSLSAYKTDFEGCIQAHVATAATNCATFALVGVTTPNSAHFTYSIPTPPVDGWNSTQVTYAVKAVYTGNTADTLTMTRNTDSSVTCVGASTFTGAC